MTATALEVVDEVEKREFGGIGGAEKHALSGKDAANGDAVDAAN